MKGPGSYLTLILEVLGLNYLASAVSPQLRARTALSTLWVILIIIIIIAIGSVIIFYILTAVPSPPTYP